MSPARFPTRHLGRDGPEVSAIGFGTMGLGGVSYGPGGEQTLESQTGNMATLLTFPSGDDERFVVLDRAWELGCTFWDSSDIYGDSEVLIGKWFKMHPERRSDIFLATKFAIKMSADGIGMDSSPEYCRQACEASLQKLGIDCIDLYYIHRLDEKTPIEKTVQEMVKLKKEGKIKHFGISECSSTSLRRAHAVHPIAAVQVEYNPWDLAIENEDGTHLLATCRELGVATVAYSPLGRGILTGQVRSTEDFAPDDFRRILERFNKENFPKNLAVVDKLVEIAGTKHATPGQLALAWLLKQGDDIIPIPGTKRVKYLEENIGAARVQVTDEEEKEIRLKVDEAGVRGARTPQGLLNVYADTPSL